MIFLDLNYFEVFLYFYIFVIVFLLF